MDAWIAYGKEKIVFPLPNNAQITEILLPVHTPVMPPQDIIRHALDAPIGTPQLAEIIKPGQSICIICDDITRPTPAELILDELLPRLHSIGVQREDIFILFALGSHRPMTGEEIEKKIGRKYADAYRVLQSEFSDPSSSKEMGKSASGNPVLINRAAAEADIRIGIGNIVPHNTLGWSGGGKILFPGIADESTVAEFHMQAALHEARVFGVPDNPIRLEIENWAKDIGLHFIVNTVLSRDGIVLGCVAGHYVAAHRAGVEKAKLVYGVKVAEQADVVITDMEPYSFDFWQGTKGLNAANLIVKDGGTVIIAGPCGEGVGPHPEYLDFMGMRGKSSPDTMDLSDKDPLAVSVGYMIGKLMARFHTCAYTQGLTGKELEVAGIRKIPDIGLELGSLASNANKPLKIAIVRDGAEVLPL